ncbi:MAG: hypothetical protein HGA22_12625, partial [Clostridiales bacterium]|nr:hypothetical protein [Clostridiales bacterium]
MKKVLMITLSILVVLSTIGVAVAATSPYVIEGGVFLDKDESYMGRVDTRKAETAVYPEAVRGYWWRDPANQNKLAEHSATDFDNQVHQVCASRLLCVYVWKSHYEGNVVLFQTRNPIFDASGENLIGYESLFQLAGTGGSREAAAEAKTAFTAVVPEFSLDKVVGIFYLDTDAASIAGVSEFVPEGASVPIYADNALTSVIQKELELKAARMVRISKMQGQNLTDGSSSTMLWGADDYLGLGSGYEPARTTEAGLTYLPTETVGDTNITKVWGKVPFVFLPTGIDGTMGLFIPGHKILVLGSPFGNYFPDVAPLSGRNVSVDTAIKLYDKYIDLAPYYIIMLHGLGVTQQTTTLETRKILCQELLTKQRDALAYVRNQTIQELNAGMAIDEIAAGMTLPSDLSASTYVQEFTTTVASAARAVYAEYFGWFDGNVTSLAGMSDSAEAACLADLAGGPKKLLEKARKALESQDPAEIQKALVLSDAARTVSPDYEATQVYIMALKKLAYSQTSAQMRNYYLSAAR